MNWEMIGAIGQMAAAIAAVPAVIYLAVQIRSQRKENRSAAASFLIVQWSDVTKSLTETAEFGSIWLQGLQSFGDLDPVSKFRFGATLGRLFRTSEELHKQHLDGVLDAETWRGFERTINDLVRYPGLQDWWSTRKHWHTDGFQNLIGEMIRQGGVPSAYSRYLHPPSTSPKPATNASASRVL
jgi:hypothetical protein